MTHNPNCAIVRTGDIRAWCDCGKGDGFMTDTPPDWVLREAAKRIGWENLPLDVLQAHYSRRLQAFHALCDMIYKYEQRPLIVDRKMLCAREAEAQILEHIGANHSADRVRIGEYDGGDENLIALRAIELWEEGFGK
jgi:hypothetical protein